MMQQYDRTFLLLGRDRLSPAADPVHGDGTPPAAEGEERQGAAAALGCATLKWFEGMEGAGDRGALVLF